MSRTTKIGIGRGNTGIGRGNTMKEWTDDKSGD